MKRKNIKKNLSAKAFTAIVAPLLVLLLLGVSSAVMTALSFDTDFRNAFGETRFDSEKTSRKALTPPITPGTSLIPGSFRPLSRLTPARLEPRALYCCITAPRMIAVCPWQLAVN